jgi:hypothetical protein
VQSDNVLYGVQAPLDKPFNTGWPVRVVLMPEKVYLFDEETDLRIAPPPEGKSEIEDNQKPLSGRPDISVSV